MYKLEEQESAIKNIKIFYEAKDALFHGEGLKILTPKQMI